MARERATGTPLLVFDTGDTFLKTPEDAANAPLVELTAGAMVEGMGKIGYDALNLGRADLLLPTALLRSLAAGAPFPLLSANVVDASGRAPFKRWLVKEVGGMRVGIFGLSGTQAMGLPPLPGRELTVQDPLAAARAAVAELRRSCQFVICLSQLGLTDDQRLAREAPGIDIILGGFTRQSTPAPLFEGSTMILQSGIKGMQLGRLEVQIVPGRAGTWTPGTDARGGEARVYSWKLVSLNTELPDDPALAALLDRLHAQLHARNLEAQSTAPPAAPAPARQAKPPYVGAPACGACHPAQLRQWLASKHARALAALAKKQQELNPECVRCHVTAFGEVGGYRLGPAAGLDLANVQCEACHGFGRDHRGAGRIRGRVGESICRRCHSAENSPSFAYEPYLKMLGEHTARYFTRSHGPASPASRH